MHTPRLNGFLSPNPPSRAQSGPEKMSYRAQFETCNREDCFVTGSMVPPSMALGCSDGPQKGKAVASLPPPVVDLSQKARDGEEAWDWVQMRFLKSEAPSIADWMQVVACCEAFTTKISCPDMDSGMAQAYCYLAERSNGNREAYLRRSAELLLRSLHSRPDIQNGARWPFVHAALRILNLAGQASSPISDAEVKIPREFIPLYHEAAMQYFFFLQAETNDQERMSCLISFLTLANTPEAITAFAMAVLQASAKNSCDAS